MKTTLKLLLLIILVSACSTTTKNTMTVQGNVKGLKKGTLYLQNVPDSTLVTIDSLEIDGDGSFSFKTEVESVDLFYLYLKKKDNNTVNDRITFFGEAGKTININTTWNSFDTDAKIEGSATQLKLEEYQKVMTRFNLRELELSTVARNLEITNDITKIDSISQLLNKNYQKRYAFSVNFALTNKDSYIAPYIASVEIADANKKYLDTSYGTLSEDVANSKYGKKLQKIVSK